MADSSDSGRGQANHGFAGFAFPPWQLWAAPGRIEQLGWLEGERPQLASGATLPPVVAMPGEDLGHRLLLDIGALQSLTGSAGQLSSLLVFAAPDERLAALRAALPDGLEFVVAAEAPDPAELTRSFHLNLAAMGLLAFVVGVFLTYNALAFSYTDRRELMRKLQLSGVTPPELAPANDTFDGRAFYAAKSASVGATKSASDGAAKSTSGDDGRRYMFGWLPTREGETDSGKWQWGGELVVHEVVQRADGT
mgnify:CR=1 FL=1